MLVATLLPDHLLLRVVEAVQDLRGTVVRATDWAHLGELLCSRPVSMVIVDPLTQQTTAVAEITRMLRQFPSTPMIAYCPLTSESVHVLTHLGRYGLREVILHQYDDSRLRLGRLLDRTASQGIVSRVKQGLQERLAALPIDIAQAVDDLFERPHAYTSGSDLVVASRRPKASLHRYFQQAGLAPPKQVFVGARVAHAVGYLRDPGMRIQDVAIKLGYRHPHILTRHTLLALGVRPGTLRDVNSGGLLTEDDIVTRLLTWVQHGGGEDGDVVYGDAE